MMVLPPAKYAKMETIKQKKDNRCVKFVLSGHLKVYKHFKVIILITIARHVPSGTRLKVMDPSRVSNVLLGKQVMDVNHVRLEGTVATTTKIRLNALIAKPDIILIQLANLFAKHVMLARILILLNLKRVNIAQSDLINPTNVVYFVTLASEVNIQPI